MELNHEQCPLCGTELSEVKFKEINAKLRRDEQENAAALSQIESKLRLRLKQQFDQDLEKQRQDLEKKVLAESQTRIRAIASERDVAAKKLKEAEAREVAVRKQAQQELAKEKLAVQTKAKEDADKLSKHVAAEREEFARKLKEAQQREVETKKAAQAEIEKQKQGAVKKATADAANQVNRLVVERDQAATKLKAAEAREAAIRKQVADEAQQAKVKELADQRQSLEADKNLALLKQQAGFNRDRESMQKKLQLVERQLQKKTANDLGDGAEIDLLEALRDHFRTDNIYPIRKGQAGADIVFEVLYKGTCCETILIESKNRQDFKMEYVTKLRKDQVEAGAQHAILATVFFPAQRKEMCIESDVILISPARVVYVAQMLRRAIIDMHIRGLSINERSTKMARLYDLINSDAYRGKLIEASKLAEEILDLDVKEKREHDNTWKKRGSLAKRVQNVLREAETEVAAVVEGTDHDGGPPAFGVKSAPGLPITSRSQGIF